eukprot:1633821-Prymnesium_polylepis.1
MNDEIDEQTPLSSPGLERDSLQLVNAPRVALPRHRRQIAADAPSRGCRRPHAKVAKCGARGAAALHAHRALARRVAADAAVYRTRERSGRHVDAPPVQPRVVKAAERHERAAAAAAAAAARRAVRRAVHRQLCGSQLQ